MDGDSFARSTFVPQLSDREITATTSIRAKLTNLVEDTNDLNNYDTAMKQLQEYRKSLKLFKGEEARPPSCAGNAGSWKRPFTARQRKRSHWKRFANKLTP